MLKGYLHKAIIVMIVCVFIFSLINITYGMEFNDDIQKITLDYDYFDGFGNDKIIRSKNDGSWYLLKSDGSRIELKGNYLDYAGIEKGEPYNHDEDYYIFVVAIDNSMTRFGFVDKDGIECLVEGYSFADPTISDKYWLLMNVDADTNYKFGLYDKYNKKVAIPVVYNSLWYFNDNRIAARNNEGEGIIDIKQKIIIPFEYYSLQHINDSFIIALGRNSKHGVININNEVVLPFEYDEIHKVSETKNYCRITKDNKFGLVNADNAKLVIPIEYESIYFVDEMYIGSELVVAQKDGKAGIVNMKNKVIVPFIYDRIELTGNCFKVYKDGAAGLLDSKGMKILPAIALDIFDVSDGFITAWVFEDYESKYAVYDMKGNEIVPPIYDYINYHASEKYMIVNNGGIANLVDKATGEAVLANSCYSDIWYVNDKYFAGGNNGYYSIVNFSGQELTPPYYFRVNVVNVNNEELLAAEWNENKKFDRNIDYFKQTKGPSPWAAEEVGKAIENNLVPFEYQVAFASNIKRNEFCNIIVAFLEKYYSTAREDIINYNKIDVLNPPVVDGFNEDIAICLHLGIVKGRGNGMFDGESEITREEAAVMLTNLARYLGLCIDAEEANLNDRSEVSVWAGKAVNFVLQSKFMQGVGNGLFSPKSNITREQTYMIMQRMLNYGN